MEKYKKEYQWFSSVLFWMLSAMAVGVLIVIVIILNNVNSNAETDNSKHMVALIAKSTESAFWKSVFSGADTAATEYNLSVTHTGPANEEDYETQNEMIRQAIADGVEIIIFSAVDYNANAEAINEAIAKGIRVIVIDSDVKSDLVSCRISTDNITAGKMMGETVRNYSYDSMKIGIVNFDKNSANGQEREQGFRQTVAGDSRIEIVSTVNVISTEEDARKGTIKMLAEHPEINVIVTFNEWTSLGVGNAIRQLELGESTTVLAFDSNIVSVSLLETGEVDGLIVQNPYAMGYLGVEYAYFLLNNIALPSTKIDTATTLVTKENMFSDECQKVLFTFD